MKTLIPKIGIFFVVGDRILTDTVPLEQGESYGDTLVHGSHYAFWSAFVPTTDKEVCFKARAYDAYPRGRVTYFTRTGIFRLYADRCIKRDELRMIARSFGLPHIRVVRDEHYCCARCNDNFLD